MDAISMYNRPAPAWRHGSLSSPGLGSNMSEASPASLQMPLVSIIVPTRNRRALLAETVESVRRQTYPNWELIIVDDGSNDGSAELIRNLANQDARIVPHTLASPKSGA